MKKVILYLIWFQAIIAVLGSLYASLFMGLTPCLLCWYQRILMYPLVIIIGVGIWRKIKDLPYLVLPFSLTGFGFALYHNLLQNGIIAEKITTCSLETPCVSSGPLPLGFISLPFLSLVAFTLINLGIIIYAQNKKIKTNCLLIHGCPSYDAEAIKPGSRTYDKHWMPWLKKELQARNIGVEAPLMPKPWQADYQAFKREFEKYPVDEASVLIGHSCGCAFLVHWLGDSKQKIAKLILVAPWKIADDDSLEQKEFYNFTIDEDIKNRVKEIIYFTADDEEDEGKESLKIYHQTLGGEIIELKNHGHYTLKDMGSEEFPELLDKILN